jgi:hypothetical protein
VSSELLLPMSPSDQICLHGPASSGRPALESFIRQVYDATYGARISAFLPLLLELRNDSGGRAVLGIRPARSRQQLFLEQYLDRPIEQEIAAAANCPVGRDGIVEIGNLAADQRGASQHLFTVLAAVLAAANFRWMVFTATPQVEKLIERLHYSPKALRRVDPARLGPQIKDWGRYYDTNPRVVYCDLAGAMAAARGHAATARLLHDNAATIASIAGRLTAQAAGL